MLISGLHDNVDYPQRAFTAPTAACGDCFAPQDLKSVEEGIRIARQMAELQQSMGRSGEWNQRVARMEENARLAAEPPRQFSTRTHQEVASFLAGTGPLPTELTPADNEMLKTFSGLVQQGVTFVEPVGLGGKMATYGNGRDGGAVPPDFPVPGHLLAPECAFLKLIAYRYHTTENQVQFANLTDDKLTVTTLRTGHLKGLDFFLRQASQGQDFYRPASQGGYEKVGTALDFLGTYADDPEAALVQRKSKEVDFVRSTAALTRRDAEGYLYVPFRDACKPPERLPMHTPQLEERDGQVVVGGVLLRRRRSESVQR